MFKKKKPNKVSFFDGNELRVSYVSQGGIKNGHIQELKLNAKAKRMLKVL